MRFLICQQYNNTLGRLASFSSLYQAEANLNQYLHLPSIFARNHERISIIETDDTIAQYDFFGPDSIHKIWYTTTIVHPKTNLSSIRENLFKIIDSLKHDSCAKVDIYC